MSPFIVLLLFSATISISHIVIETKKDSPLSKTSKMFFSRPITRKYNDCEIQPNPFKNTRLRKRNDFPSTSTNFHDFIMEQLIHENKLHRNNRSFKIYKEKVPKVFGIYPEPTPKESFIESIVKSFPRVYPSDVDILTRSNPFDVAENLDQVFLILRILNSHYLKTYKTITSRAAVSPTSSTTRIEDLIKTPLRIPKNRVKTDQPLFLSLHTIIVILNSLQTFDSTSPKIKTLHAESINEYLLLFNRFIKELFRLKKAFRDIADVKSVKSHNFIHVAGYLEKVIEQISDVSYKSTFNLVSNLQSGQEYGRLVLKAKLNIILKINKTGYIWRAAKIILSVFKENQALQNKIDLDMNILKINTDKERFRKCDVFLISTSYKEGREFVKGLDYLIKTLPTKNINDYYKNFNLDGNKKQFFKLYQSVHEKNEKKYFKYVSMFESYRDEINKTYYEIINANKNWENIKLLLDMFNVIKTEDTYNRDMKFNTPKTNKTKSVIIESKVK